MKAQPRHPPGTEAASRGVAGAALLGTGAAALTVLFAFLLSRAIAAAFLDRATPGDLSSIVLVLGGVAIARACLLWLGDRAAHDGAAAAKALLRSRLIGRVVALGPVGMADERTGEITRTIGGGVESLDAYAGQYLPQRALAWLVPLAIGIAILAVDPLSALVLGLTYPLIPLFMVLIGATAEERTKRQWTELSRLSTRFFDAVQGLATLKAFGRSATETAAIAADSERFRDLTLGVLRVAFLSALVLELIATLATAIVAVEVGLRLLYNRISFAEALFVLVLAPEFYRPLRAYGAAFHAGMPAGEAGSRARMLLSKPPPFGAPALPRRDSSRQSPAPVAFPSGGTRTEGRASGSAPSVRLTSVTFSYTPGRDPSLTDVTFTIPAAAIVALAGPSGSGKSTVVSLLLRLLEPARGDITVDGRSLREIDPRTWREGVAWVPQRPHIFNGTLRDNLLIARADASEDDIMLALEHAHASEFVAGLPDGVDTAVGELGARLSGGQAQRLALARAFLRDAPFVVLDEPTASLDPAQEGFVADSVRRLAANRTTLVVAHRLSTLARADHVVMLSHGRVVEEGRHEALLAGDGPYARLFRAARAHDAR